MKNTFSNVGILFIYYVPFQAVSMVIQVIPLNYAWLFWGHRDGNHTAIL